jgi:ubiquinol-cytochrome c reductase cytochrome c1 subunit
MVRFLAFLIGLGFVFVLFVGAVAPREKVEYVAHGEDPEPHKFSFSGPMGRGVFGTFDQAQLQRGFQVYREVCSACHGLTLLSFRNLTEIGFSAAEVKAIAAEYELPAIDPNTGEDTTRKAVPSDRFPPAFPNETAARAANNNAYPPDLSLITKARHHGPEYVRSLLMGYVDPPAGKEPPEGLNYNKYFPTLYIAMVAPLSDDQVTYNDGTKATVEQMSTDVAAFLTWTAEPTLIERRKTGLAVVGFLAILTVLAWFTYKAVWADVKKGKADGGAPQPAE